MNSNAERLLYVTLMLIGLKAGQIIGNDFSVLWS